jgi:hypothetical protein
VVEREIVSDECWSAPAHGKLVAALFDLDRLISDRPDETGADRLPMTNLPRVERRREVELRRGD